MAKIPVCPHCGHDEIHVTTGYVEARQVIEWDKDKEPLELDNWANIYCNMKPYICNFCYKFFDKPKWKKEKKRNVIKTT